MTELSPFEEFFKPYDNIAVDVVSEKIPNTHIGLQATNFDMVEYVCKVMNWEDFDLFGPMPFEEIYKTEYKEALLAYTFVAFLRTEVWGIAQKSDVGEKEFNEKALAHSTKWYRMLRDRYNAVMTGTETKHIWLH